MRVIVSLAMSAHSSLGNRPRRADRQRGGSCDRILQGARRGQLLSSSSADGVCENKVTLRSTLCRAISLLLLRPLSQSWANSQQLQHFTSHLATTSSFLVGSRCGRCGLRQPITRDVLNPATSSASFADRISSTRTLPAECVAWSSSRRPARTKRTAATTTSANPTRISASPS